MITPPHTSSSKDISAVKRARHLALPQVQSAIKKDINDNQPKINFVLCCNASEVAVDSIVPFLMFSDIRALLMCAPAVNICCNVFCIWQKMFCTYGWANNDFKFINAEMSFCEATQELHWWTNLTTTKLAAPLCTMLASGAIERAGFPGVKIVAGPADRIVAWRPDDIDTMGRSDDESLPGDDGHAGHANHHNDQSDTEVDGVSVVSADEIFEDLDDHDSVDCPCLQCRELREHPDCGDDCLIELEPQHFLAPHYIHEVGSGGYSGGPGEMGTTETRTRMILTINGITFQCVTRMLAEQGWSCFSAFESSTVSIYDDHSAPRFRYKTSPSANHFRALFSWIGNVGDSNNYEGDNKFDYDNYAEPIVIKRPSASTRFVYLERLATQLGVRGINSDNIEKFITVAFAGIIGHSPSANGLAFDEHGERMRFVLKHMVGPGFTYKRNELTDSDSADDDEAESDDE
jgi:hypothetical protein